LKEFSNASDALKVLRAFGADNQRVIQLQFPNCSIHMAEMAKDPMQQEYG
jgi:hypothetical protein